MLRFTTLALIALVALPPAALAQVGNIPQIPAALPYAEANMEGPTLPIDGTWRVVENHRKYRVEAGRFIAEHDYVDLLVFKVMADMIVAAEFVPDEKGGLKGRDLGWKIPWTLAPKDGGLEITIHSLVGPAVYHARPVKLDDEDAFAAWSGGEDDALDSDSDGDADDADDVVPDEDEDDSYEDDDDDCTLYTKTPSGFVCAD